MIYPFFLLSFPLHFFLFGREFGTRQLLPSLPCCLTTANPVDTQGLEEVHSFDETEQLLTTLESTQISTDDSTMDPDKDSVAQSVLVPPTEPLEESPTDEELVLGLRRCFLQALKYRVTKSDPLPILSNVFYANNLLPVISANLKSAGPFNIKKTPYKKVGTFLEAMQSAGYIELKEASKGVQSVVAINWSHSDLESLRRADYMEEISEEQENHSQYKLPEIAELFSVTSPVATVLCVADPNIRKGMELSAKQVREMLVSYVRGGQLQVGRNVTLDPHLSDLVQAVNKTKSPPAQMSIDDLVATVLQGMTECYSITYSSGKVVKKKAKLPHINISVAQRAANKRVRREVR